MCNLLWGSSWTSVITWHHLVLVVVHTCRANGTKMLFSGLRDTYLSPVLSGYVEPDTTKTNLMEKYDFSSWGRSNFFTDLLSHEAQFQMFGKHNSREFFNIVLCVTVGCLAHPTLGVCFHLSQTFMVPRGWSPWRFPYHHHDVDISWFTL